MKTKKALWISALLVFIGTAVGFSVNLNKTTKGEKNNNPQKDTIKTNPKIDIKVNKEYDDEGNIIRYDSTYSYIYTYPDGDQESIDIDSLFQSFQPYFFDHSLDIMQDPFKRFFQKDSFYEKHFFEQDYFMQQFEKNRLYIDKMIKQMDSLRNHFLKETFPELDQDKTEPERKKTINL